MKADSSQTLVCMTARSFTSQITPEMFRRQTTDTDSLGRSSRWSLVCLTVSHWSVSSDPSLPTLGCQSGNGRVSPLTCFLLVVLPVRPSHVPAAYLVPASHTAYRESTGGYLPKASSRCGAQTSLHLRTSTLVLLAVMSAQTLVCQTARSGPLGPRPLGPRFKHALACGTTWSWTTRSTSEPLRAQLSAGVPPAGAGMMTPA